MMSSPSKSIDTVPQDIYEYLEGHASISQSSIKRLAEGLTKVLTEKLVADREPSVSMSSIGKPLRKLWYDVHSPEKPNGQARLKFLYGDIIEELLLWLIEETGHTVTHRQHAVSYQGVSGSIDSIIDGVLTDEKSCSSRAFSKFKEGKLPQDDPFGYLAQIAGYREGLLSEGIDVEEVAFVALDKTTGEVAIYKPDTLFDLPRVEETIQKAQDAVSEDQPPASLCYQPVPFGTGGNMQLGFGCRYCPHKFKCFPDLKVFKYAEGKKYLTTVKKEPRVEDITTTERTSND